jgi:uncharacterized protein involved in response to NO
MSGAKASLSLRRLADAPHRLFFFFGTVGLLATSLWWLIALLLRYAQSAGMIGSINFASSLHPLVMIFGFFPFFIFGFAFTAGPRWLQMPPPPRPQYFIPGIGMGLAFLSLFPAMFFGDRAVVFCLIVYVGFAIELWYRFSRLISQSAAPEKVHARIVQVSLAIGGLTLGYAIFGIGTNREWVGVVRSAGIWGFLVPLICTVCHRMLPFFTATALNSDSLWRPWWLLAAMVGGAYLHGLLDYFAATHWLWIVDGPMAIIGFMMVWRWGLIKSLRNRMLAMLHLSFVWLAIAYTLSCVQSLLAHAGIAMLGLGPMHAVSIGFLASITIAMVTRVTYGHSGRIVAADAVTWALFLIFQLVAVSRVAAEIFPAHYAGFIVFASVVWFVCLGVWGWRNAPIYLSPRVDGMAG